MKKIITAIIAFFMSIFGINSTALNTENSSGYKPTKRIVIVQHEHFSNVSHKRGKNKAGKSRKKNRSAMSRRAKNKHRRAA